MNMKDDAHRHAPRGDLKICSYDYLAKCGINASRSSLLRWEKEGRFPARVRLGPHLIGWVQQEIDEYLEQLAVDREVAR